MNVYIAGENGKHRILAQIIGGGFVLDTIFSERFYFTPFFGIRVRFGA